MRILELFSGTGTLAGVARDMGHEAVTVDNDPRCGADICGDFRYAVKRPREYDMIWASPPCESFSVASIGHHWGGGHRVYEPKTTQARESLGLIRELAALLVYAAPLAWYVENPVGVMRKVSPYERVPGFFARHTVTYCQYNDEPGESGKPRMKPTDIWTSNYRWVPRPRCHNGDPCHEAAPRGSKTGTQGRGSYLERSRLPEELCREVIEAAEMLLSEHQGQR